MCELTAKNAYSLTFTEEKLGTHACRVDTEKQIL